MSEGKIITYEELKQNNKKESLYLLIHQKGASCHMV